MPERRPQSKIARRGEKTVRRTEKTVAVARPKATRKAAEPVPDVAVDQRRQITGTDELPPRRGGRGPAKSGK